MLTLRDADGILQGIALSHVDDILVGGIEAAHQSIVCCLDDGRRASRTHEPQGRGLAAPIVGVGGLPDRAPYPFQMTEHGCTRFTVSCGPAESSLQPIKWLSSICSKVRTYSGQVMPMWNLVLLAPRANQRRWSKVTGTGAECTPCHQSLACIIAVAVSHTYPLASFFLVVKVAFSKDS